MSKLAVLVNKLGHELEEIRLRSLNSIISKLDNGLISHEELLDKDNLFQNLTKWFQYRNTLAKEDVLKLILRLIKSQKDASVLLLKADPGLAVLRGITDFDVLIQDIINITSEQVNSARYIKSDGTKDPHQAFDSVGSKSIHSLVSCKQSARNSKTVGSQSTLRPSLASWDKHGSARVKDFPIGKTTNSATSVWPVSQKESAVSRSDVSSSDRMIWSLPRVPLVASDLHVITTVQDSLSSSSVNQTCHFFVSVMLQDFPPQVFLQNPGVVYQLITLLRKPSATICAAVECLAALTQLLLDQLIFCSQLEFTSNKHQSYESEGGSTPRDVVQQYQLEGSLSGGSVLQMSMNTATEPLPIPQYCLMVLSAAAQLVGVTPQASPLTLTTLHLLSAVIPDTHTLLTHPRLSQLLHTLLDELTTLVKRSVTCDTVVEVHVIAVTLQIVDALVPVDMASAVLPTELQDILCFSIIDPMLVVNYPELHATAINFANILEHKGTHVYREVLSIMEAMKASVCFSHEMSSLSPTQALQLFKESLPALPFHRNMNLIEEFIKYMLERPDLTDSDIEEAAQVTRALLAHSDTAITLETYRVCHKVVSSVLGPRSDLTDSDIEEAAQVTRALLAHSDTAITLETYRVCLKVVSDLTDSDIEEAAQVTRALLAHSDTAITLETYRVCLKVVSSVLGPQQALSNIDPGPRILFLTHTSVLVEITCFGVTSLDNRIQQNAEDILTYLLKCQLLVSERWWCRLLERMSPVLPLLQCHTSKMSALGRAVLNMLDPDIANCSILSNIQVLLGNARLLFHKDTIIREEAVARLLWLTGLTDPHNKRLADLCVLDVAVTGHTPVTGMYEASSVVRVVELLSAPSVEARVRQSAITQLSVMTEDPRLHQVFIDNRGVELFISILQQVMGEINEDTGCSAIPIVATLKNLARHNSTIRQSLSQHEQFILHLIKGMFQLSEWRLQRDGAQLLALLVYADYVLSCPASVSLPHLITQTLHLPWLCQSHWAVSPHSTPSLRGVVLGEMGAERLLSTYWAVLTVGLDHLLELSHVTENNTPMALSQRTLRQLQASNIPHGCRCSLYSFQNATTHTAALQALAELTSYLEISWLTEPSNLASLPWKNTFKRFLLIPPSGQDDFNLLFLVLKFLQFLLEVSPEQSLWVSEALLCPPHTLLQLIMVANSPSHDQEMWKKICLNTLAVLIGKR
ncbi:rotatin [Macrosteles quadrilineatus]|uniref:rotatin n=1 Tax=Macrosteles quadrilineatus TaxID=74068 RepID=UPI0023E0DFB9|nr:rotatin [Macrosteles quadrilineatus]